jgi:glycosyltransferase involved in cell wall biosynthesis
MRIGINTIFYIPQAIGGVEVYLLETIQAMLEALDEDELVVFTSRENHAFLLDRFRAFPKVSFLFLDFTPRNLAARVLFEHILLPFQAKKEKIDSLWSPGYVMPLFAPCPQFVTVHDMQHKRFPKNYTFVKRTLSSILVSAAIRRADMILTDSEFSRNEISRLASTNIDRIVNAGCAVTGEFAVKILQDEVRVLLKDVLNDGEPYLLCVANSYPHKNIHYLVKAFGSLANDIPHKLVLVGRPGGGEKALTDAIKALPDPSRVVRIKYISTRALIALYQGAELFVLPSRYEGFGIPLIESMMAGTPVLTTREGSIPEICGEFATYFVVDNTEELAEKIFRMVSVSKVDKQNELNMAREWAQSFTWHKTASVILDTMRKYIGKA